MEEGERKREAEEEEERKRGVGGGEAGGRREKDGEKGEEERKRGEGEEQEERKMGGGGEAVGARKNERGRKREEGEGKGEAGRKGGRKKRGKGTGKRGKRRQDIIFTENSSSHFLQTHSLECWSLHKKHTWLIMWINDLSYIYIWTSIVLHSLGFSVQQQNQVTFSTHRPVKSPQIHTQKNWSY